VQLERIYRNTLCCHIYKTRLLRLFIKRQKPLFFSSLFVPNKWNRHRLFLLVPLLLSIKSINRNLWLEYCYQTTKCNNKFERTFERELNVSYII